MNLSAIKSIGRHSRQVLLGRFSGFPSAFKPGVLSVFLGLVLLSPFAHAQGEQETGEALIKGILGTVIRKLDEDANGTRGTLSAPASSEQGQNTSPFIPSAEAKSVKLTAAGFAGKFGRNRVYLFTPDQYLRLSLGTNRLDRGFPRTLQTSWPDIPDNLDAASYAGLWNNQPSNRLYLFKNGNYWLWDLEYDEPVTGFPRPISTDFPGLPDHLDAAVYSGTRNQSYANKIYFFSGDSYWRWNVELKKIDNGYPKSITQNWPGLPRSLDAATFGGLTNGPSQDKLYFFKGDVVFRWDLNADRIDDAFPSALSQPAWDTGNSVYTRNTLNNPFDSKSTSVNTPIPPTPPSGPTPSTENYPFVINGRILAYWNDGYWYPARITSIQDSEFSVQYDGGGTASMGPYHISKIDWGRNTQIHCKWQNGETWYPASIVSMTWPNLVVQYGDGQKEATITGRCRSQSGAQGGLAADHIGR